MNFDPNTSMTEAVEKERQFSEFFRQAKAIIRNFDIKKNPQKWTDYERELSQKLRETKNKVHHHLCNNIDTPSVISELSYLIVETNKYMKGSNIQIKSPVIVSVAQYILRISRCLGIVRVDQFEYSPETTESSESSDPFIQALVDFRDQVKQHAGKDKMILIKECDKLRDVTLAGLGVSVEDTGMTTPSVWMKQDPETLLKAIQDKKDKKERELKEKEEKKALEEKKKSCPPNEWYSTFESDKYSKFDAEGCPTHDNEGKELKKEIINGLKKQLKAKEKKYQKYLQQLEKEAKKQEEPTQTEEVKQE